MTIWYETSYDRGQAVGEQDPERCIVYCLGLPRFPSPFPPLHSTNPVFLAYRSYHGCFA